MVMNAVLGNTLLFVLVFGMSATVDVDRMRQQVNNGKAIVTGILLQFLLLPFLGFIVVRFLDLPEPLGLTLLVVTSSPGGSYSNWFCSVFNADLALSVTMTAISTILSILFLPANLLLYTRFSYPGDVVSALDWTSLFIALGIVISAITIGLCSSYYTSRRGNGNRKFQKIANHMGNFAGFCLILFSALMTNTGAENDSKIWSRHWRFYVGVALPCVAGLLIANVVASSLRLRKPERVSLAVECCYQNVGIATSLALTMFNGEDVNEAMGVPFLYGLVEAVAVGCYVIVAWKAGWTQAPANAPLWRVMWTSYEVLKQEAGETGDHIIDGIEINLTESKDAPPGGDWQDGSILTTFIWWDNRTEEKAAVESPKQSSNSKPSIV